MLWGKGVLLSLLLAVHRANAAPSCFFCFAELSLVFEVCSTLLGDVNEQSLKRCLADMRKALSVYNTAKYEYESRRNMQTIANVTVDYIQNQLALFRNDKEANPVSIGAITLKIQSIFNERASTLKTAPDCIPPCGYQKTSRYLSCERCSYADCDLPVDCPMEYYNVDEYAKVTFRCAPPYKLKTGLFEELIIIWKFAKKMKTQDGFYFHDIYSGEDPLLMIKPVRVRHSGTYLCETIVDGDTVVRLYFYLNVTSQFFQAEHELQKMFKVILHSHEDIDETPDEVATISLQNLLEGPGFLRKKSVILIITLVALITMMIALVADLLYKYSTNVR